jgi:hypothetical protein
MNNNELEAELRTLRAITMAQTVAIVKLLSLNPQGRQDIALQIGPTLDLTLAMTLTDAEREEIERQLRMFAGLPQVG